MLARPPGYAVLTKYFATRDEFIAASIPTAVIRTSFLVGGNTYAVVRDATGPIVQANGQRWRPDDGAPIVILHTGQSNSANVRTDYNWQPQGNVFLWNNTGTQTGTAFIPMPADAMSHARAFADEVAKMTGRPVFVIQSGRPGRSIINWLPDAPDEDVYALDKARVEAALAQLPGSTIDMLVWWHGESDSALESRDLYSDRFNSVSARWGGEDWFPENCPIRICGVVSTAINGSANYSAMNRRLQRVAWEPNRSFFQTHEYLEGVAGGTDWIDALHPTGLGYEKAGRANARELFYSRGLYTQGVVYDPEADNYGFGISSEAGLDFDYRIDKNQAFRRRLINLGTGDDAETHDILANSYGTFTQRLWGNLASGRLELAWTGTSHMQIKAPNAAAGISLYAGENTETLRVRSGIMSYMGGGAERFRVTQTSALFTVPVSISGKLNTGALEIKPGSSASPTNNGDVTFELTSNTLLTIKARGTDGVVRTGTVALA